MIIRTRRWLHSTLASHDLITSLLMLGAASLLVVAGQACGGSSLPDSALDLIPEDASSVTIWDMQLILEEAPREYQDAVEDFWGDDYFDHLGVSLNNLATSVEAQIDSEDLTILEGGFDIEQIRNEFDDADYDDEQYRGYKMWKLEIGGQSQWLALIEDRGQVVIGSIEVVKSVLRTLDRGSGSLLDDDNEIMRVLKKTGYGWTTVAQTGCDTDLGTSCQASASVTERGQEDHLINITLAFLFEDKSAAKSQIDELDEDVDELLGYVPGHVDIEEVRIDGEFVLITITMDEDILSN